MKTLLSFLAVCCLPFAVFSQKEFSYSKSDIIVSKAPVVIKPSLISRDFRPRLTHLEMPVPGGNSYRSFLMRQKELIKTSPYRKTGGAATLGEADSPIITGSFKGNSFDGIPNDNHLAISNAGKLISVINSSMIFYDTETDSVIAAVSLHAFFDTLNLPAGKFDPRVIYDPKQDRFILICLSGNTDSTNNVLVAFSTSDDPMDDWHCYSLQGNPLNDSSWSDYPLVAITDEELFITVNLLNNDTITGTNDSWKYLFKQSIIWQINKLSGFSAQPLEMRLYDNVLFNGKPIRNLCPIQGGSTTSGPGIYLLSNRNFDLENDTFFILHITGLLDDIGTYLQMSVSKADIPYGLAPDGQQRLNRILQTNDSRVLSGYIEDDLIHFVQNSIHPDTARAAIYHGIIGNVSSAKNVYGKVIGDASLDFGYPNIAYTGKYAGDDEAIITFNHTSADTFPGFSAVFFNSSQGYSNRVTLKSGSNHIYIQGPGGNRQRWGDYSGSQRKYDEPGKVWAAGCFGDRLSLQQPQVNATWIAAVVSPDTTLQPPASIGSVRKSPAITYPNPVSDIFSTEFELTGDKFIDISLFDATGKRVKTFIRDTAKSGKNRFSFSIGPLSEGVYFLRIMDGKEVVVNQKIVKQNSGTR